MSEEIKTFPQFLAHYLHESTEQANFRGRVDQHLETLNGRMDDVEDDVDDLADDVDDKFMTLTKETAMARLVQKHPKLAITIIVLIVTTAIGLPILI